MTAIARMMRAGLPFSADTFARVALVSLVALALVGAIGPLVHLGGNPHATIFPRLVPPGVEFPFGTDTLGRSLLPRVVEGIRPTFVIAAAAVLIASFIGTGIGMVAGYVGSIVDEIAVRAADVLFSFPGMLLALMVAAVAGRGAVGPVVTIVLATSPLMIRVARAATLRVKNRDYVVAARVGGASTLRILMVHLLPNVAGAMVVQATYALSVGMIIEGGMSFLGLGVQPPQSSLGSLLEQGKGYITVAPWLVLAPGLTLALAILSVNLVGDGVRDALEPRQPRTLT
jgi:peptide/nickel transport system permease protein